MAAEVEQTDGASIMGRVQLGEADFVAIWGALPETRALRVMLYVLPFALVTSLLSVAPGLAAAEELPLGTIFPAIFVTTAIVGGVLWSRRAMAKAAMQDLGGAGRVELELSAQGLRYRSEHRQGEVAWGSMQRSLETNHHFILYTGVRQLMPMPKRAFAAADLPRLRQLLAERAALRTRPKQLWPAVVGLALAAVALLSVWHFLTMEGQPRPVRHEPTDTER